MGLDTTTGQSDKGKTESVRSLIMKGTPKWRRIRAPAVLSLVKPDNIPKQITRRREINQDIMVNFNMPVNDFNINALVGFNGNERKSLINIQKLMI